MDAINANIERRILNRLMRAFERYWVNNNEGKGDYPPELTQVQIELARLYWEQLDGMPRVALGGLAALNPSEIHMRDRQNFAMEALVCAAYAQIKRVDVAKVVHYYRTHRRLPKRFPR